MNEARDTAVPPDRATLPRDRPDRGHPPMFQPSEETREREVLAALQLERLRGTVARIAASNPAYHRHLGSVTPEDLASLDDLRRLPFLAKDQLRASSPSGLAGAGREPVVRIQMSSGTTGAPIVNPYTEADVGQWKEIMARSLTAAGVSRDDVILVTASFGLFTGGFG